jgi:hypothetical protein
MTDEPTFFDRERANVVAFARNSDPDTSHQAAESITPRIRQLQVAVLAFASTCPDGFTDPLMNDHFQTHSSTYRTRRSELVDLGMIEDTGNRLTLGPKGRKHALWRITAKGADALDAAQRAEAA